MNNSNTDRKKFMSELRTAKQITVIYACRPNVISIVIYGERGIIIESLIAFNGDIIRNKQFYFYLNFMDEELPFRQQRYDFAEER